MESKKRNDILRETALATNDKTKRPNGYVYAYVDGNKEFYALDKVYIAESDITVGDLAKEVKDLKEKIYSLEEFIKRTLKDLSSYKTID